MSGAQHLCIEVRSLCKLLCIDLEPLVIYVLADDALRIVAYVLISFSVRDGSNHFLYRFSFQLLLVAAELVVIALFRELDPVVIGILVGIGSLGGSVHSSMATLCTLATKGKAVETVSSLFTGATFVGEFLCGYVPPIVAGLVLGEATPSNNLLVSGIACAIFAIITIPVCNAAYKLAFPDEA